MFGIPSCTSTCTRSLSVNSRPTTRLESWNLQSSTNAKANSIHTKFDTSWRRRSVTRCGTRAPTMFLMTSIAILKIYIATIKLSCVRRMDLTIECGATNQERSEIHCSVFLAIITTERDGCVGNATTIFRLMLRSPIVLPRSSLARAVHCHPED